MGCKDCRVICIMLFCFKQSAHKMLGFSRWKIAFIVQGL
jgi:hypothetical protein